MGTKVSAQHHIKKEILTYCVRKICNLQKEVDITDPGYRHCTFRLRVVDRLTDPPVFSSPAPRVLKALELFYAKITLFL